MTMKQLPLHFKKTGLVALASGLLALPAYSATLVEYSFATNTAPTFVSDELGSASNFTSVGGARSGNGTMFAFLKDIGTSDNPDAVTFSFTLGSKVGETIDFSSLSFDVGYQNSENPVPGHPAYSITYHLQWVYGGNTYLHDTTYTYDVAASDAGSNGPRIDERFTFDLTGLQGITGDIVFTLKLTKDGAAPGTIYETARFDNVSVDAIPEPGSIALAATGLAAALFLARRRSPRHC